MADRLTNRGSKGEIWITDNDETRRVGRKEAAYELLFAYENTGLTPKQCVRLAHAQRGGWIPVGDRLPSAESRVLVWAVHEFGGYASIAFYEAGDVWSLDSVHEWDESVLFCSDSAIYDDEKDDWKVPEGWYGEGHDLDGTVTHRQSLPQAPKGGKHA